LTTFMGGTTSWPSRLEHKKKKSKKKKKKEKFLGRLKGGGVEFESNKKRAKKIT